MFEVEVLVLELSTIDALTTGAVALSEVTTLDHKPLDDPVEHGTLVVEWLSRLANTFLSSRESPEVLGCLRDNIVEQLEGDTPSILVTDLDVEVDAAAALRGGFCGCHFFPFACVGLATSSSGLKR